MDVYEKYEKITKILIEKGLTITTMESCTAGSIASLITDTEGSSAILKGAFVTYSNEAKIKCGVSEDTIRKYGVYSKETAMQMAAACKKAYGSDIGIGITGSFSNPDPNNADSVPGVVYLAIDYKESDAFEFVNVCAQDRRSAKLKTALLAADKLLEIISSKNT